MGLEAKYTAPLVGVSSAANKCNSVLFPAPDGATIATISPRRKLRFASAKTVRDRAPTPYCLQNSSRVHISLTRRKVPLASPYLDAQSASTVPNLGHLSVNPRATC